MSDRENRARVQAAIAGQADWGTYGNAREHLRYAMPVAPTSRRRCSCGCGTRSTHVGCVNGLGMMSGCELRVQRWIKEPAVR